MQTNGRESKALPAADLNQSPAYKGRSKSSRSDL